eukprot:TRINITY_DN10948_c0_g1_i1.p1 TRINITY_DN10948_c0_g1~~TRINITY_DN10948_c0_g1_i1.p1  ORF type:complete len:468 (+),score=44.68 TRINITY_DN10948_c0_g1_i1:78-1481(+)
MTNRPIAPGPLGRRPEYKPLARNFSPSSAEWEREQAPPAKRPVLTWPVVSEEKTMPEWNPALADDEKNACSAAGDVDIFPDKNVSSPPLQAPGAAPGCAIRYGSEPVDVPVPTKTPARRLSFDMKTADMTTPKHLRRKQRVGKKVTIVTPSVVKGGLRVSPDRPEPEESKAKAGFVFVSPPPPAHPRHSFASRGTPAELVLGRSSVGTSGRAPRSSVGASGRAPRSSVGAPSARAHRQSIGGPAEAPVETAPVETAPVETAPVETNKPEEREMLPPPPPAPKPRTVPNLSEKPGWPTAKPHNVHVDAVSESSDAGQGRRKGRVSVHERLHRGRPSVARVRDESAGRSEAEDSVRTARTAKEKRTPFSPLHPNTLPESRDTTTTDKPRGRPSTACGWMTGSFYGNSNKQTRAAQVLQAKKDAALRSRSEAAAGRASVSGRASVANRPSTARMSVSAGAPPAGVPRWNY